MLRRKIILNWQLLFCVLQIYQVAYVIIKAANSPRPGTWILEKSLNGKLFLPWQYFATSDKECMERFGVPSKKGKHYNTDTEVICTHLYSRLTPMENGEVSQLYLSYFI